MTASSASPRVLVLGGINMGLITRAGTLPAPGQTLRGERFYSSPGGKGATQAVAASRQGGRVKMVGRVGGDLFGPALLESLRSHGVDTSDVAVDAEAASGVGVILVDGSGQNRVLATYGANLRCGGEQLRSVEAALPETDVLLLQMEIPFDVSLRAARAARDRNVRVILDPAPAAHVPAEAFTAFDIIAPNQTEAEYLVGVAVVDVESASRAAGLLLERGAPAAVIKMAELGACYRTADEEGYVPAFAVEAVDTTSAGDAFHGALAVALAEGRSLRDAVSFAAAAGALAVTRPGVQDSMPGRAAVEELLTRAGGPLATARGSA